MLGTDLFKSPALFYFTQSPEFVDILGQFVSHWLNVWRQLNLLQVRTREIHVWRRCLCVFDWCIDWSIYWL